MSDAADIPKRANITELEDVTGLSRNPIVKHIKRHDIKKDEAGKYSTKAVLDAILRDRQMDGRNDNGMTVNKLKATKMALECQVLQVKLDELKKLLWHRDEVMSSWTERNTRVTSTIENWRQGESEKDGTVKGKARIDGLADMLLGMLSEEFDQ
jgi:hypothetical protein